MPNIFGKRGSLSERPFYIYYGLGTQEAIDRLRQETLVILELRQWKASDLSTLRATGTKIYGYISVLESPLWLEQRIRRLSEPDYWYQDGKKVHFDKWNSYLMDIRSVSYRHLLLEECEEMQLKWPLDGIFLDTVGDIEEYIPLFLRKEVSQAYRSFLAVASNRFPQLNLIQNRGFTLLESCASLLHGVLWEDWRHEWTRDPYASRWIDLLRKLMKERNFEVYAVSSTDSVHDRTSALKLGFNHRHIESQYQSLPEG